MTARKIKFGIRLKLSAAFIAVSMVIAGFAIAAIEMQLETTRLAALVEGEQFARLVAYTGPGNALSQPGILQRYVDGLHALYGRDIVFVDRNKKGIADTDQKDIGTIFNEDLGNEIGQTIQDGIARTFIEGGEGKNYKQIVVPLRVDQSDPESAIVGAVIVEYTHVYDRILESTDRNSLYLLAAFGIGSVLLSVLFGLQIAARMARRITRLQEAADIIANGNYDARVTISSRDEVGSLGAAFNTMAGELKRSRDGLEERVESRTRELTQANLGIERLNRVYAVLSKINELIARVKDRTELFEGACRIAVEAGQFRMCWVGLVDRDRMNITLVASAGTTEEHLSFVRDQISLDPETPKGENLVAHAIREKKPFHCNDTQNTPGYRFSAEHARRGTRSVVLLPLVLADEAIGVLALYSDEAGFFDEEELKLLADLAHDIAFAIDHIDKRERLDYLAYYDELTGLANRTLFLEGVTQYIRGAVQGEHKLAVLLIDLERFKNINDSLGRASGDALLKQVAVWLTDNMGDDNLVARVGADHFAVVLPELKQAGDVARLVAKSSAAFQDHPFQLNGAPFRVAAKCGVAVFPDDGATADVLFRNAEAALKKAKAGGERYLFYTQKMNETVAGNLALENQLRRALDNEEFVLHYQPKVNLASGKVTGAEALIRWNDPRMGLVPPGTFIPVLEETGLIHEVGRWALRKAVEDYLRWRAMGLPAVRIAVNMSPVQLRDHGFIAEIRKIVGDDPHAAAGLELEITESMIMENVDHSIASLQAIRALGVTIAIDDFGTGFSSLGSLSKLPVDSLKIDRSFVVDMMASPQGLALVSTIIKLAHSLNLKTVAEGVETADQSKLLRLLSCNEMQGFLFSKAVPGDVFEKNFLAVPAMAL